ncbi:MAG: hypothetical protein IJU54_02035 [Alphaproteobacteria bacterium]|nr:hypothetical protein [Alphaproteobacteria bacterium]
MLRSSKILALGLGLVLFSHCGNAGDRANNYSCIGGSCYTQQFNKNINIFVPNETCLNCNTSNTLNKKMNKKEKKRIEKEICVNCQKCSKKFPVKKQNKQFDKGNFNKEKK